MSKEETKQQKGGEGDTEDEEKLRRLREKRKQQKKKRQEKSVAKREEQSVGKEVTIPQETQGKVNQNATKKQKSATKTQEINIPKPSKQKKKKKGKKELKQEAQQEPKQEEKQQSQIPKQGEKQKQKPKQDEAKQQIKDETIEKVEDIKDSKDSKQGDVIVQSKSSDVRDQNSELGKSDNQELAPRKYKPNVKQKLMYLIDIVKDSQKGQKKVKRDDKRPKVEIIDEEEKASSNQKIEAVEEKNKWAAQQEKKEVVIVEAKIQEQQYKQEENVTPLPDEEKAQVEGENREEIINNKIEKKVNIIDSKETEGEVLTIKQELDFDERQLKQKEEAVKKNVQDNQKVEQRDEEVIEQRDENAESKQKVEQPQEPIQAYKYQTEMKLQSQFKLGEQTPGVKHLEEGWKQVEESSDRIKGESEIKSDITPSLDQVDENNDPAEGQLKSVTEVVEQSEGDIRGSLGESKRQVEFQLAQSLQSIEDQRELQVEQRQILIEKEGEGNSTPTQIKEDEKQIQIKQIKKESALIENTTNKELQEQEQKKAEEIQTFQLQKVQQKLEVSNEVNVEEKEIEVKEMQANVKVQQEMQGDVEEEVKLKVKEKEVQNVEVEDYKGVRLLKAEEQLELKQLDQGTPTERGKQTSNISRSEKQQCLQEKAIQRQQPIKQQIQYISVTQQIGFPNKEQEADNEGSKSQQKQPLQEKQTPKNHFQQQKTSFMMSNKDTENVELIMDEEVQKQEPQVQPEQKQKVKYQEQKEMCELKVSEICQESDLIFSSIKSEDQLMFSDMKEESEIKQPKVKEQQQHGWINKQQAKLKEEIIKQIPDLQQKKEEPPYLEQKEEQQILAANEPQKQQIKNIFSSYKEEKNGQQLQQNNQQHPKSQPLILTDAQMQKSFEKEQLHRELTQKYFQKMEQKQQDLKYSIIDNLTPSESIHQTKRQQENVEQLNISSIKSQPGYDIGHMDEDMHGSAKDIQYPQRHSIQINQETEQSRYPFEGTVELTSSNFIVVPVEGLQKPEKQWFQDEQLQQRSERLQGSIFKKLQINKVHSDVMREQPVEQDEQQQKAENNKEEIIVKKRDTLIDALMNIDEDDDSKKKGGTESSIEESTSRVQQAQQPREHDKKPALTVEVRSHTERLQIQHEHSPYPHYVKQHDELSQKRFTGMQFQSQQTPNKQVEKFNQPEEVTPAKVVRHSPFLKDVPGSAKRIIVIQVQPEPVKVITQPQINTSDRPQLQSPIQATFHRNVERHQVMRPLNQPQRMPISCPSEQPQSVTEPKVFFQEAKPVIKEIKVITPSISSPMKMPAEESAKVSKSQEEINIMEQPIQRQRRFQKFNFPTTSCRAINSQPIEINICDGNDESFAVEIETLRKLQIKPAKKEITVDLNNLERNGYKILPRQGIANPAFSSSNYHSAPYVPVTHTQPHRQVNILPASIKFAVPVAFTEDSRRQKVQFNENKLVPPVDSRRQKAQLNEDNLVPPVDSRRQKVQFNEKKFATTTRMVYKEVSPISPRIQMKYNPQSQAVSHSKRKEVYQVVQPVKKIVERPMKSPFKAKLSIYSPKNVKVVQLNIHEHERVVGSRERKEPIHLSSKKRKANTSVSPARFIERGSEERSREDKPSQQSRHYSYQPQVLIRSYQQHESPHRKNKLKVMTKTPPEDNKHKHTGSNFQPFHNVAEVEKPVFNREKIKITLKNPHPKRVIKNLELHQDQVDMKECYPFFDPLKNSQK